MFVPRVAVPQVAPRNRLARQHKRRQSHHFAGAFCAVLCQQFRSALTVPASTARLLYSLLPRTPSKYTISSLRE